MIYIHGNYSWRLPICQITGAYDFHGCVCPNSNMALLSSKCLLSWCDCRWKLQIKYKAYRVILAAIWSVRLSHRHWAVNYRLVKVPYSCPKAFGSKCSGAGLRHPQLFLLPTHLGRELKKRDHLISFDDFDSQLFAHHWFSRSSMVFVGFVHLCLPKASVFFQQFQSDQPCMIHQVVR